jgi:hypothetical protein
MGTGTLLLHPTSVPPSPTYVRYMILSSLPPKLILTRPMAFDGHRRDHDGIPNKRMRRVIQRGLTDRPRPGRSQGCDRKGESEMGTAGVSPAFPL